MNIMNAGKGDNPRPVDKKVYNQNFDQIDWKKESSSPKKSFSSKKGKTTIKY